MRKFKFNQFALSEMIEASQFYENERTGLGYDFLKKIRKTVNYICTFPESGSPLNDELRKYTVMRFPYSVIYSIEANQIDIVAIAHQRRRPNYWEERLQNKP